MILLTEQYLLNCIYLIHLRHHDVLRTAKKKSNLFWFGGNYMYLQVVETKNIFFIFRETLPTGQPNLTKRNVI